MPDAWDSRERSTQCASARDSWNWLVSINLMEASRNTEHTASTSEGFWLCNDVHAKHVKKQQQKKQARCMGLMELARLMEAT